MQSVDDMFPSFEVLKLSAFKKASIIKNEVHNVTIGPNKTPPKRLENQNIAVSPSIIKELNKKPISETKRNRKDLLPLSFIEKVLDRERTEKVRDAVKVHSKKFDWFAAKQDEERKIQNDIIRQRLAEKAKQEEELIQLALKNYEANKANNDREQLAFYYQQVEKNRKKSTELLQTKKIEREIFKCCLGNQAQFHSIFQDIMMMFKNCQDEKLKTILGQNWKRCKDLNESMKNIISQCKVNPSMDDQNNSMVIVEQATQIKLEVTEALLKYGEVVRQEIQQKNEKCPANGVGQITVIPTTPINETYIKKAKNSSHLLENYVSEENFKWYSDINNFHDEYTETLKELLEDDRLKQFRFDCKKAINLSVNAISAVNHQHLCDKYTKLSNLLLGNIVVIGDFQVSASRHPKGIQFCTDLLARKFVLQGDLMVSSNPESAFSFATIIVSLWNECPDFGKLLLSYFFKECPYLVPFYIPKAIDQTDEDFYRTQGYKYTDGQIEKHDKFLKRMTGIMRLYFAILISPPKQSQKGHPHNLKIGWAWFVSVLQLEPRMEITATMVHTFLDTIGFEMHNVYRTQFFKLLRYFIEQYLTSMKKIDSGGPVTRIECLIQKLRENGNQFKPPNGLLARNFW